MNTPDQTEKLANSPSDNSSVTSPKPDLSPVGIYALVFLGLAGPVLSFGQWGQWDALRWILKIFGWISIFAGCLLAIADLRIRRMLRFTPYVSGLFTAFMVWMSAISEKPIMQTAVSLIWFAIATIWFTYLRLKVPQFFGLPCHSDKQTAS